MQIFYVAEGSSYANFSLNEKKKKLTVENIVIDLEASVLDDSKNVINITRNCCDGSCMLGLDGKAGYVADIEIPPRQYEYKTTGKGEDAVTEKIPLPLDLNTVVLNLWPYGTVEKSEEEGEK